MTEIEIEVSADTYAKLAQLAAERRQAMGELLTDLTQQEQRRRRLAAEKRDAASASTDVGPEAE